MGLLTASLIQLASPSGVGYNEEATIKLQGGLVYQIIELETNLVNKPTLKRVTIDIGGTPVVYFSGADLQLLDRLYKKAETAGRFTIDLAKFKNRLPEGIYRTALATSNFDDITLKVEFGSIGTGDPATPTLRAKAYVSANPAANTPNGGRTYIPEAYEVTQYAAAAGEHEWAFPNGSANRYLQTMILDEAEVRINRVSIKRGLTTIAEMTRSDIEHGLKRFADVAIQPNKLLLDFTKFGFGAEDAIHTRGLNFTFDADSDGAIKTRIQGFRQLAAA